MSIYNLPEVSKQDANNPYNFPDATDLATAIELLNKLIGIVLFDENSIKRRLDEVIDNLNDKEDVL